MQVFNRFIIAIVAISIILLNNVFAQTVTELGPKNTPAGSATLTGTGRVEFITFDVNNSNLLFTGSATGGLFYSTDGGGTWKNGGTDDLPTIGVSACVIDPNNSNNWFIATGDGDLSLLDGTGHGESPCLGIYRGNYNSTAQTIDWTNIGNNLVSANDHIKKLLIDPSSPSNTVVMYAATNKGIFKTTNALAASVTWTNILSGNFYDIEFLPVTASTGNKVNCNPCSTIYASGTDIYESTNSGSTWSTITAGMPSGALTNAARISIEVTPANSNYLYAFVTTGVSTPYLYLYDASTGTWSSARSYSDSYSNLNSHNFYTAQSLAISPYNASTVYIGNYQPINKSTNGGVSWTQAYSQVHNDIHHIMVSPHDNTGNTVWAATDGGVYKSTDGGISWTDKNNGLGVATVYQMASSVQDPYEIETAQQDCGENLFTSTNGWKWFMSEGDGYYATIDYEDGSRIYAEGNSSSSEVEMSMDGGNTYVTESSMGGNSSIVINTSDHTIVFTGGGNVNRTDNYGQGTTENISGANSNSSYNINSPYTYVNRLFAAPSNPNYLYAYAMHCAGGCDGTDIKLYRTENANDVNTNVQWTDLYQPTWTNASGNPVQGSTASLSVSYEDPKVFWIAYFINEGWETYLSRLYKYDGNTNTWTQIVKSFPSGFPTPSSYTAIVNEHGSNEGLYLGTDKGVFYTNNTMNEWVSYNYYGLPNVRIGNLEINYTVNKLRAGTYGRGVWEMDLYCPTSSPIVMPVSPPTNNFYETQSSITSNLPVTTSVYTTFRAGTYIELDQGFVVDAVSDIYTEFKGFIHSCINTSGYSNGDVDMNTFKESSTSLPTNIDPINSSIVIYPNPNDGSFSVSISDGLNSISEIYIYDLTGKELYKQNNVSVNTINFELPDLEGFYILKIVRNGKVYNERFLIQR